MRLKKDESKEIKVRRIETREGREKDWDTVTYFCKPVISPFVEAYRRLR